VSAPLLAAAPGLLLGARVLTPAERSRFPGAQAADELETVCVDGSAPGEGG
jgi:hypothetical protein